MEEDLVFQRREPIRQGRDVNVTEYGDSPGRQRREGQSRGGPSGRGTNQRWWGAGGSGLEEGGGDPSAFDGNV